MRIGDICTREVVQCSRTTTALELAQIMQNSHVGDVVVVDQPNGKKIVVGLVTDRDLVVEILARETDPVTATAGDIMRPETVTAGAEADIYEAAELMRLKGVRRIPIVDEDGGLLGIVTMDDLLNAVSDQLALLARVVARERFEEEQSRR